MSKYPNSGTLGRNERREKDSHPEYSGKCEIDGKAYWISAWVKEGDSGKFFSLSFRAKDEPATKGSTRKPQNDDDIPF